VPQLREERAALVIECGVFLPRAFRADQLKEICEPKIDAVPVDLTGQSVGTDPAAFEARNLETLKAEVTQDQRAGMRHALSPDKTGVLDLQPIAAPSRFISRSNALRNNTLA
jgi:hypothetical protein